MCKKNPQCGEEQKVRVKCEIVKGGGRTVLNAENNLVQWFNRDTKGGEWTKVSFSATIQSVTISLQTLEDSGTDTLTDTVVRRPATKVRTLLDPIPHPAAPLRPLSGPSAHWLTGSGDQLRRSVPFTHCYFPTSKQLDSNNKNIRGDLPGTKDPQSWKPGAKTNKITSTESNKPVTKWILYFFFFFSFSLSPVKLSSRLPELCESLSAHECPHDREFYLRKSRPHPFPLRCLSRCNLTDWLRLPPIASLSLLAWTWARSLATIVTKVQAGYNGSVCGIIPSPTPSLARSAGNLHRLKYMHDRLCDYSTPRIVLFFLVDFILGWTRKVRTLRWRHCDSHPQSRKAKLWKYSPWHCPGK